jgi:hypothetical protein
MAMAAGVLHVEQPAMVILKIPRKILGAYRKVMFLPDLTMLYP